MRERVCVSECAHSHWLCAHACIHSCVCARTHIFPDVVFCLVSFKHSYTLWESKVIALPSRGRIACHLSVFVEQHICLGGLDLEAHSTYMYMYSTCVESMRRITIEAIVDGMSVCVPLSSAQWVLLQCIISYC